jgi:FKBP-type peptidyl-prolyl cis-trans isomerase FklB
MKSIFRYSFILSLLLSPFLVSAGTNEEGLAFLKENKDKEGVVELPSGLQYKIVKKGTGAFHPAVSSPCLCHYEGTLIDGTKFDSSYDRGDPTTFAPNQVIKGWTEAMQLMTVGDKWELYIPSDLGYGDSGSPPKIPGGAVLIFTMEIIEIQADESTLVPALNCDVTDQNGCNDDEKKYITKINAWDDSKKSKEVERLNKIMATDDNKSNVKPDLINWMRRRLYILNQFVVTNEAKGTEL